MFEGYTRCQILKDLRKCETLKNIIRISEL